MIEKIMLKIIRCDNGLKINIQEESSGRSLSSIWYENNPQLEQDILIGEFSYTGGETIKMNITLVGWNTRLTPSHLISICSKGFVKTMAVWLMIILFAGLQTMALIPTKLIRMESFKIVTGYFPFLMIISLTTIIIINILFPQ